MLSVCHNDIAIGLHMLHLSVNIQTLEAVSNGASVVSAL